MIARNSLLTALVAMLMMMAQTATAFMPLDLSKTSSSAKTNAMPSMDKIGKMIATLPIAIATSPLVALAEEVDDYEYGAVNAPIGIAWAGGVLVIATALLPLALQGGEEAFEEMKDRDSSSWGTGQTDALKRRKK
uniref:PSII 6.1 kDa protein n=1 Tax=Craspedostauros australis TaxID=1486917 RepID=A0A7R9WYD4_9STRA|eukprot:CAMPEP_0198125490 /NCGR_PEP_ID=MMETSP1442-20131203/42715_1 /TAXON_ID= /ORGANISM="Craspedostauros australis, Strain CCMP3328" /LENGTH=134 /DNA_ID=CAMNT_0043785095 /DNA_START=146 /DNA_END=550 /DNA_ORIENTATION=+